MLFKLIKEGFQKCYYGKNIALIHCVLLLIIFSLIAPMTLTFSLNLDFAPIIIMSMLTMIIILIFLYLYLTTYIANCIKFFAWKTSQTDEDKIKRLQIMPALNRLIFKNGMHAIGFILAWSGINVAASIVIGWIPLAPVLISVLFTICWPYIYCDFCKTRKLSAEAFHVENLFSYLPKVFVETFLLNIINILANFALLILFIFPFLKFNNLLPLSSETFSFSNIGPLTTTFMTLGLYLSIIFTFVMYYAIVGIYYEKIELERLNKKSESY